jgi:phosphatidylethanolamine-binding protein (PEBP) family uncharacterized protein
VIFSATTYFEFLLFIQEKFYEVLMIDPDAPSEKNPKCRSWLHMLLSDVKVGRMLS